MKNILTLAVAAALASGAAVTQAYEAGDWILRAGAVTVAPDADSDIVDESLPVTVDVDDNTQLSIIGAYMVDPHWGIELLAATPFSHDIDVNEVDAQAGETKHLPPTLSVQWYPRGGSDGWQPYLGVEEVPNPLMRKLRYLDNAADLNDLRVPPGNRLEKLSGDRRGLYSIRINEQYRICFRWAASGPYEVEIVDYHN